MGLVIIISSLNNVQRTYVFKKMMFKKFFFMSLIGTITSAIVGIIMIITLAGICIDVAMRVFKLIILAPLLFKATK